MDAVRGFNNELSSLYECKPPISKAKMTSVTKSAIKAIKFYKHVVQSVEKFVQKCRPEYKVPGLYVVDSIVRQSRHQFGADKDVFAPRFARNITAMFQNLFKCPPEEKSKIVRVLNLWQKNNVFPSEVIQPLLDMANPNHPVHQQPTAPAANDTSAMTVKNSESINWPGWSQDQNNDLDASSALKTVTQLLQHTQQNQPSSVPQPTLDTNFLNQLQQITSLLTQAQAKAPEQEGTVKFNKKLLDFDYGDEEDDDEEKKEEPQSPTSDPASLAASMAQNLLSNPDLLHQLQQMQQTIQQTEALKNEMTVQEQLHKQRLRQQEEEFTSQIQSTQIQLEPSQQQFFDTSNCSQIVPPNSTGSHSVAPTFVSVSPNRQEQLSINEPFPMADQDDRQAAATRDENDRERSRSPRRRDRSHSASPRSRTPSKSRGGRSTRRSSRRSRTRSKSPRRRRSRSRSGSRSRSRHRRDRDRDRRSRSRERDREKEREREREKEKEKEREKERKKRGLPPMKKEYLSVCSTTLWLGHVSKLVSEEDLADTFGEYGDIVAIDMIPPRGCAFVCMNRRQDAYRALQKLKNLKLQGKTITMAWAPGKGVKGKDYKDYWDADLGVSYIPIEKLPEGLDLDALEEGGMIDEDTVPEKIKQIQKEKLKEKAAKDVDLREAAATEEISAGNSSAIEKPIGEQQQPSLPLLQPLVQPQYGLPVQALVQGQPMPMMSLPMGVPPPAPMMMVPPVTQSLLGQPVPIVGGLPQSIVTQPFTLPASGDNLSAEDATPTQESQDNSEDALPSVSSVEVRTTASASAVITTMSSAAPIMMPSVSGISTTTNQVSLHSTTVSQPSPVNTVNMGLRPDFVSARGFQPPPNYNPILPPPSFRHQNFDVSRPPPPVQDSDRKNVVKDSERTGGMNPNVSAWNKESPRDMGQDVDMRSRAEAYRKENANYDLPSRGPSGMMKPMGMQDLNMQRPARPPPMLGNMDLNSNSGLMAERVHNDRYHIHAGFDQVSRNPKLDSRPIGNRVAGANTLDRISHMERLAGPNMAGTLDRSHMNMMDGLNGPLEMDRSKGAEHAVSISSRINSAAGLDTRPPGPLGTSDTRHPGPMSCPDTRHPMPGAGGPESRPPVPMGGPDSRLPRPLGAEPRPNMFPGPGMHRFGGPRMTGGPGGPAGPGMGIGPRHQFGRFPGPRPPPLGRGGPQDGFPPRPMPPRGPMFPGNRLPFMGGPRPAHDKSNVERPSAYGVDRPGPPAPFGAPEYRDDRFRPDNNDRYANDWKRRPRSEENYRDRFQHSDSWLKDNRASDDYSRDYPNRDRFNRDRRDNRDWDRDKDKSQERDRERDDRDWNRNREYRRNDDRSGHRDVRDDRERNRKSRWSDADRKVLPPISNDMQIDRKFVPTNNEVTVERKNFPASKDSDSEGKYTPLVDEVSSVKEEVTLPAENNSNGPVKMERCETDVTNETTNPVDESNQEPMDIDIKPLVDGHIKVEST